jgi:lactoylglutathione lyase
MRIEHIAIWAHDLEKLRSFYTTYFGGQSNEKYVNPSKNFSSYFITFDNGCRLELMHKPEIPISVNDVDKQFTGIIHIAFSLGSKDSVDQLTERLRRDGYRVVGEPRTTGDGYYESVVLDPEGNRLEICA